MQGELAGQTAIVTGASRGLGAAIAEAMWDAGGLVAGRPFRSGFDIAPGQSVRRSDRGKQIHLLAIDLGI